jgi:hypothetical protein
VGAWLLEHAVGASSLFIAAKWRNSATTVATNAIAEYVQ